MHLAFSRRSLLTAAAVAALATGVSGAAFAHVADDANTTWRSAASMAAAAGCSSSYQAEVPLAGSVDVGTCQISGSRVEFVVLQSDKAAYTWEAGYRYGVGQNAGLGGLGRGWVLHVHSPDRALANKVLSRMGD